MITLGVNYVEYFIICTWRGTNRSPVILCKEAQFFLTLYNKTRAQSECAVCGVMCFWSTRLGCGSEFYSICDHQHNTKHISSHVSSLIWQVCSAARDLYFRISNAFSIVWVWFTLDSWVLTVRQVCWKIFPSSQNVLLGAVSIKTSHLRLEKRL